jgi:hypothetical protein
VVMEVNMLLDISCTLASPITLPAYMQLITQRPTRSTAAQVWI